MSLSCGKHGLVCGFVRHLLLFFNFCLFSSDFLSISTLFLNIFSKFYHLTCCFFSLFLSIHSFLPFFSWLIPLPMSFTCVPALLSLFVLSLEFPCEKMMNRTVKRLNRFFFKAFSSSRADKYNQFVVSTATWAQSYWFIFPNLYSALILHWHEVYWFILTR